MTISGLTKPSIYNALHNYFFELGDFKTGKFFSIFLLLALMAGTPSISAQDLPPYQFFPGQMGNIDDCDQIKPDDADGDILPNDYIPFSIEKIWDDFLFLLSKAKTAKVIGLISLVIVAYFGWKIVSASAGPPGWFEPVSAFAAVAAMVVICANEKLVDPKDARWAPYLKNSKSIHMSNEEIQIDESNFMISIERENGNWVYENEEGKSCSNKV